MEDENVHSFIIKILKPRTYSKPIVKDKNNISNIKKNGVKITKPKMISKPSDKSLEKYTLPGDRSLRIKTLKKDSLVLPYKLFLKKEKRDRYKKSLSVCIRDKYKIMNTDLMTRLYVDSPSDDVNAITDVDSEFFTCGVSESHMNIALYKSLNSMYNNILRLRQEIGYRNDAIINIDTNIRKELQEHTKVYKKLVQQAKYFDNFVAEDYHKSMGFLGKWDKLKIQVNKMYLELGTWAGRSFTVMSKLISLDYRYDLQHKYGRFLYYLSPPSWRFIHREFARSIEIEVKGFDFGSSSEEDAFPVIFEKIKQSCYKDSVEPVLYFVQPSELMDVFDSFEKQQLNHFSYVTQMTPYTKLLKAAIIYLKADVIKDNTLLTNVITNFKNLLTFSENRSLQLQARFFKILNGLFYESVGTIEVLKLSLHLNFCHEQVCKEKSENLDIVSVAKSLESYYMHYSKELEATHGDTVQFAVNQYIEKEKLKAKNAKIAVKELRLFERLERDLLRTFAHRLSPQSQPQTLPLKIKQKQKKRIKATKPNVNIIEKNKRSLTEGEIEYLTLFTNWKTNEDPTNYLLSFRTDSNVAADTLQQ